MKRFILLLCGLAAAWNASAKISLPEIIGSDMVLQQNASARLWGWTDPNTEVRITTSWGGGATVRSDGTGRWLAEVRTPAGGYEPQRITLSDGEETVLENILVGEVWFAGGQSNMEMPLCGFWACPVEGSNEIIARAGALRGRIRYVKIPKTAAMTPQPRVAGRWQEFTCETAPWCSATGFFFAEQLNATLDVPVGIIDCSWGGSRVEGWLDRATLESYPDEPLTEEAIGGFAYDYLRPLVMFNGMLYPLTDYTIRGFIWYQGESNVGRHDVYAERLAQMAALWRRLWREGDIPFYFVEIAPYDYGSGASPYLREAQWRAAELIPESGIVSTADLVEEYERPNIHPKNKRGVGRRLAYMALNRTYGFRSISCDSPQYASMEVRDGKAYVAMKYAGEGYDRMTDLRGFEICGADRVFRPATAEIGPWPEYRLIVSSPEVPDPVAVRYAFGDFAPGNLGNTHGLPVAPFRTDDFPFEH